MSELECHVIHCVFSCEPYEADVFLCAFDHPEDADAFRDRCIGYDKTKPEHPGTFGDVAAEQWSKDFATWLEGHPAPAAWDGSQSGYQVRQFPLYRRPA